MISGSEGLTSMAPLEIVPSLDHTDGELAPGLGHVAHMDQSVLLRVILQYDITGVITIITTCIK